MAIAILACPTELGLRREWAGVPSGTVHAPDALRAAGIVELLGARDAGDLVPAASYNPVRRGGVLNADAVEEYSNVQAAAMAALLDRGEFPLVLGGDCSLLLGSLRALQPRGRYGLVFLDGHTDYYTPSTSGTGGIAGMDLFFACQTLVDPAAVAHLGRRDLEESVTYGGVLPSTILDLHLELVRELGPREAARRALERMQPLDGFFIHVDVDVLDDEFMPCVDSRQPGGLSPGELREVLDELLASRRAVAAEVTIFDPTKDEKGERARALAELLTVFRSATFES